MVAGVRSIGGAFWRAEVEGFEEAAGGGRRDRVSEEAAEEKRGSRVAVVADKEGFFTDFLGRAVREPSLEEEG